MDWIEYWKTVLLTNDLTNANTGLFDPRHMNGVTNQDVFRWPGTSTSADYTRNYPSSLIFFFSVPSRSVQRYTKAIAWNFRYDFTVAGYTDFILGRRAGPVCLGEYSCQLRFWSLAHVLISSVGHARMLQRWHLEIHRLATGGTNLWLRRPRGQLGSS